MIPPYISNKSHKGEADIFNRLKDDPGTKDWIVLHSLDIAEHIIQIAGEIDFVIIVPQQGVLCLEVKGTYKVERGPEGEWYYGNNSKPDIRGPFKQSSDGMHSIRLMVKNKVSAMSSILFYSAVAFPYVPFKQEGEWHSWQIIDQPKFHNQPISKLIGGILNSARSHILSKDTGGWIKYSLGKPSPEQCESLIRILRPSFEYTETAKSRSRRIENELIEYTEEQFECLDYMSLEPRVVFTGPAGTGKTLLALEAARRSYTQGKKVGLICFNSILGDWLIETSHSSSDSIKSGTVHQLLVEIVGYNNIPSHPSSAFWRDELPKMAVDALLENDNPIYSFDELIIDEMQDLLKPSYLEFFDLILKNGLAAGNWKMFGDFENQMIYGEDSMLLDEFISERVGNVAKVPLRVNCRNTPRIATAVQMHTMLYPYKKIRRPDNEVDCEFFFYKSKEEQKLLLVKALESLYKANVKGDDIVILSPLSDSTANNIDVHPWKDRLNRFGPHGPGIIPYTTIHAFKGMERQAVVITDVDHEDINQIQSLLYIGMTRAVDRLIVLASEKYRKQLAGFYE